MPQLLNVTNLFPDREIHARVRVLPAPFSDRDHRRLQDHRMGGGALKPELKFLLFCKAQQDHV